MFELNLTAESDHLLTSENDLCMAINSICTMSRAYQHQFRFIVHQGGSFQNKGLEKLKTKVKGVHFVSNDEFSSTLKRKCPPGIRPLIEYLSIKNPVFKKMISPFIYSEKDRYYVIDSDVLWFKKCPKFESAWKNTQTLCNQDESSCYVRPLIYLRQIFGNDFPENFNDGILYLFRGNVSLNQLFKVMSLYGNFVSGLCPQTIHAYMGMLSSFDYLDGNFLIGGREEFEKFTTKAWHFAGKYRSSYQYGLMQIKDNLQIA